MQFGILHNIVMPFKNEEDLKKYRETYRKLNKEKIRKSDYITYYKNHAKRLKTKKLYYEKNKKKLYEKVKLRQKEYKKEYKVECKAREILSSAVRSGKLIRGDKCSRCGEKGLIDGHHFDYGKPLEVLWLCRPCHRQEHAKYMKNGEVKFHVF